MSQPVPPEQSESTPTKSSGKRLPRLPQLGRSRWLALGVGAVLLGGAVAGAAVVADHDRGENGDHMHIEAVPGWKGGDGGERRTRGEGRGESGFKNDESRTRQNTEDGQDSENGDSGLAPAPVPAVSAAKAIEAAGKAVPGGKPDALRVVVQQGGGSGWEVEVLGTDGVRHLVTLDGATGAVTGNTVASAARIAGH
ncbi:PepSY domain-containing protein [Streptomyces sp. NPDC002935]|uniref:PepSY domain-containing protein n=1 Tax=Streptomyces sp. NPDC002935 TaxID=3154545 RepID=UPI0033A81226